MILIDEEVYVDGYRVSEEHNMFTLGGGREMKEKPRFGRKTRAYESGVLTWTLQGGGLWSATADQIYDDRMIFDEALFTAFPKASVVGDPGYALPAVLGSFSPVKGGAFGEQLMFSVDAVARGDRKRARLLARTALAATGTGAGLQIIGGVPAGKRLYGGLHVVGVAGVLPTLDAWIESAPSAAFAAATTRRTFTQRTAIGAEFTTGVAGPITDPWFRFAYTIGGAAPSFTVLAWLAIR